MKIKLHELTISGDMFPHSESEEDQFYELSALVLDELFTSQPREVEVTEGSILLGSVLASKNVFGVLENVSLFPFQPRHRYSSGDVTSVVSESLTIALLKDVFKVDLRKVVPGRTAKFVGAFTDLYVPPESLGELERVFEGRRALFVEIRGSATGRGMYEKAEKAFRTLEAVRYPRAFGMVSFVTRGSIGLVYVR
ncbi:MAG: hypothetical protein L7H21_03265 [Sulfolobales archaeon]|nr:hypothetical protein [Sulfolobales archaeon]MCG2884569.1 hypothetical protein [Sulfolobales archaeon]MCG2888049.1 hypothetical protein [Sulfolobales archaeon]MCG2893735.1 hypothetical protein [Sulfolobales archaeon]MCG2908893.1 hypothetical protein [Sulfolobales archaeon]